MSAVLNSVYPTPRTADGYSSSATPYSSQDIDSLTKYTTKYTTRANTFQAPRYCEIRLDFVGQYKYYSFAQTSQYEGAAKQVRGLQTTAASMHLPAAIILGCFIGASITAKLELPKGKKIQWVGHSFHWFLPEPVAALAKEAGIQGHQTIGLDRIGASEPCQHWDKGGATNPVKENLKAGKADILTLATREKAPDPCIPKFVKLAVCPSCSFQYHLSCFI